MKKLVSGLTRRKIFNSGALTVSMLVLIVVIVVGYANTALAWFTSAKEVSATGMQINVAGNFDFSDTVTVERYFDNTSYVSGVPSESSVYKLNPLDYQYYLIDNNGNYQMNGTELIPLSMTSLLPEERININFTIVNNGEYDPETGYELYIGNIYSDTFIVNNNEEDIYSVLGICHMYSRVGDLPEATYSDNGFIVDYEAALPDGYSTHEETRDDETKTISNVSEFIIRNGSWEGGTSLNITVQLYIDLTKYNDVAFNASNLLSEKRIHFGELGLRPYSIGGTP